MHVVILMYLLTLTILICYGFLYLQIETQKLNFKESAKSRTDSGTATPKAQTESVNSQDSVN